MKKLIVTFAILALAFVWADAARASNAAVSNTVLQNVNTTNGTVDVKFDLAQDNTFSGTDANGQAFYDRVWVFVKFWDNSWATDGSVSWGHATLTSGGTVGSYSGATGLGISTDGKGAFCSPGTNQTLRWSFTTDGISAADTVKVRVMAIEMVYIPEGAFYAGDTTSTAYFREGGGTSPYQVSSEAAITVANTAGNLYYQTGGNYGDGGSPIPAAFPKGYDAFYIMKYEISQGQYRDFLNTLTSTQAGTRYPGQTSYRHGIRRAGTPYVYYCDLDGDSTYDEATDGEWVACNYLSWADVAAYSDWAGLRPMTELEFEKACRGGSPTDNTVAGEYAWGSASAPAGFSSLYNSGQADEQPSSDGGTSPDATSNLNYSDCSPDGPIRAGGFAAAGTTRAQAGASYYGVMELSGNVWERPITVGHSTGRSFTGSHGDGTLDGSGNATNSDWPDTTATGAGFRGGAWGYAASYSRVSDRSYAASVYASRYSDYGGRSARTP